MNLSYNINVMPYHVEGLVLSSDAVRLINESRHMARREKKRHNAYFVLLAFAEITKGLSRPYDEAGLQVKQLVKADVIRHLDDTANDGHVDDSIVLMLKRALDNARAQRHSGVLTVDLMVGVELSGSDGITMLRDQTGYDPEMLLRNLGSRLKLPRAKKLVGASA